MHEQSESREEQDDAVTVRVPMRSGRGARYPGPAFHRAPIPSGPYDPRQEAVPNAGGESRLVPPGSVGSWIGVDYAVGRCPRALLGLYAPCAGVARPSAFLRDGATRVIAVSRGTVP